DVGVNVLNALRIASQHTGNAALVAVAMDLRRYLEDGRELHQALARHPELFGGFYVEMTRQGEEDGTLGKALLAVADYLERLPTGASPASMDGASEAVPHTSVGVAATAMVTLGILALGAAVLYALATIQPPFVPSTWLPTLSLLWAGVCLIAGAWLLMRV